MTSSFHGGVVTTEDIVLVFNKIHHKSFTLKVLEDVVTSIPTVVYFRKNSYLVNIFNEKLDALKSSGLIGYWAELYRQSQFSKLKEAKSGPKVMTLKTLKGTFQIIVLGLLASILVFAVELLSNIKKTYSALSKLTKVNEEERFNRI